MLNQVQHDNRVCVFFCHPEPGPEPDSGSNDFGISVLSFKIWVLKPSPVGGVTYIFSYPVWPYPLSRNGLWAWLLL
jgi:hypothetical protein